jgi:hypothetical protein
MMMIVSSSRHARRVLSFVAGPCFTAAPARRRTALTMASSYSLQDFQRVELEAANEERRRQHDVSVGSTRIGNCTDEGFLAGFEQELELCKEALDAGLRSTQTAHRHVLQSETPSRRPRRPNVVNFAFLLLLLVLMQLLDDE